MPGSPYTAQARPAGPFGAYTAPAPIVASATIHSAKQLPGMVGRDEPSQETMDSQQYNGGPPRGRAPVSYPTNSQVFQEGSDGYNNSLSPTTQSAANGTIRTSRAPTNSSNSRDAMRESMEGMPSPVSTVLSTRTLQNGPNGQFDNSSTANTAGLIRGRAPAGPGNTASPALQKKDSYNNSTVDPTVQLARSQQLGASNPNQQYAPSNSSQQFNPEPQYDEQQDYSNQQYANQSSNGYSQPGFPSSNGSVQEQRGSGFQPPLSEIDDLIQNLQAQVNGMGGNHINLSQPQAPSSLPSGLVKKQAPPPPPPPQDVQEARQQRDDQQVVQPQQQSKSIQQAESRSTGNIPPPPPPPLAASSSSNLLDEIRSGASLRRTATKDSSKPSFLRENENYNASKGTGTGAAPPVTPRDPSFAPPSPSMSISEAMKARRERVKDLTEEW